MNANGQQWATLLGLAARPLFREDESQAVLRDGVWGSFVVGSQRESVETSADWTWSAYARHHVTLTADTVEVFNIASPNRGPETFSRRSVDRNLEKFYIFLRENAKRVSRNVVDHISGLLHSHMGELSSRGVSTNDGFLLFLGLLRQLSMEDGEMRAAANSETLFFKEPDRVDRLLAENSDHLSKFREQLSFSKAAGRTFHADLAIRHAAGTIFQAAHHIVTVDQQGTLFGLPASRSERNRALPGVHYTPVSLARALVTFILRDLDLSRDLTIADPTCGSGIFLAEVINELSRRGFSRTLRVIGIDSSEPAVMAARFNVAHAVQQEVSFRVETRFLCGDALELLSDIGMIDCALMNPPFVPWEALSPQQRDSLKSFLGDRYSRRPDIAMMFMSKTFAQLSPGGRLACVLPVGVMAGDSARKWRASFSGERILFDGVLSDHQLFEEATVSVGAIVLEKGTTRDDDDTTVLWSDNQPSSSDDALRHLKRSLEQRSLEARITDRWGVFSIQQRILHLRGNWRPPTGRLTAILERLSEWYSDTLGNSFAIRLGIRTGNRAAFVVDRAFVDRLPPAEKRYVRPIAEGSNISNGQIQEGAWLIMLPSMVPEEELSRLAPTLLEHLSAFKDGLEKRSSVPRNAWWTLSRMRDFHKSTDPRLVSKEFFRREGFALDFEGRCAVVTGYSWQPRWNRKRIMSDPDGCIQELKVLLNVLDSDVFFFLCREYSTLVGGGQVDLSPNQIAAIPFPSFRQRAETNQTINSEFARMSAERRVLPEEYPAIHERNRVAAEYFGVPLEDWPLTERWTSEAFE
jgi:hypothetical protein